MRKRALSLILLLALCLGLVPTVSAEGGAAYASTQTVLVDGSAVVFQAYALKDQSGNDTNYVKLRDVAQILNGTAVQFEVGWNGAVNIETGKSYTPNGSEMKTPFTGNRAYSPPTAPTNINGAAAGLEAIVLTDDAGGAYTYYKLRDLGAALGFLVDWSAEKGIFIETGSGQVPTPTPTPVPTPAPTPAPTPEQPKALSAAPLYEDSNVKINFVRVEKYKYGDDQVELYLDVDNKTNEKITVQCDAVSLNGYCFNNIIMSDDVSADSIGTVNASIEGFDFSLVSLDKVETVGGQFRIIPASGDSYSALFPARNIYTAQTDSAIPSAGDRTALYSDSKVEIFFDHAEPYKYSSDGSRIEVYLMVRNKTSKTLLIQNDTVKVDRRSFEDTVMSDPVLPYSTGYVNVSVEEYTGPAANTITTIGGDFRIIDDAARDSYDVTLGSLDSLGSDGGKGATPPVATDPDTNSSNDDVITGEINENPVPTTSITGGRVQINPKDGMLLNYAPGVEAPDATYPNFPEVPDFGLINGIQYDPKYSNSKANEEGQIDDSYWYHFNLGLEGYTAVGLAELRNAYLSELSSLGFSNPLGTSLHSESASDMMVKNTDNGRLAVHMMVAADPGIGFGFIIISIGYF